MSVLETLFFGLLALATLALVIYFRIRENRYVKKKTKEALSPKLRKEIEFEESEALRKKEKFEATLKQFSGESKD